MYLLSSVFKDTEMAFIGYVCINLFISVNTIISTSIIYFLGQLNQNDQVREESPPKKVLDTLYIFSSFFDEY